MRKSINDHRSISCEPLEDRRLFATFVVAGTEDPDHIVVSIQSSKIVVDVNDQGTSVLDADFDRIQIDASRGDDVIEIINTGANTLEINMGDGDDTVDIATAAHDLDVIGANITLNGGDGKDFVTINDQNDNAAHTFSFAGGNAITRSGANTRFTVNDASAQLNCGSGVVQPFFVDMPLFDVDITSTGSPYLMSFTSDGTESIVYTPSGSVANAGTVDTGVYDVTFSNCGFVACSTLAQVEFVSPNSSDTVDLTNTSASNGRLAGASGFINFAQLRYSSLGVLRLNLGAHNAVGTVDSVLAVGGSNGVGRIDIVDPIGNNTINVTSGSNWFFDTGPGAINGANITMNVTGAGTQVTFGDSQTLKRLQIDNGATVSLMDNGGAVHEFRQLATTVGTGTLDVQSGVIVNVPAGGTNSFIVGVNDTFVKKGAGTLNVSATQTHPANANFEQQNGITNLNSDVGTISSHLLNVHVAGGVLNANTSQHMKSLTVDGGAMTMSANGNRVLATGPLAIDATDAMIDLADNDLHATGTSIATMHAYIAAAHNFGGWDGPGGIFSSTARDNPAGNTTLGLLSGQAFNDNNGGTFNGLTPNATDALVKYTYFGDVDFNGAVDVSDYNLIDFGFSNGLTGWGFGDADYSGGVDVSDYNLIDFAFATQTDVL